MVLSILQSPFFIIFLNKSDNCRYQRIRPFDAEFTGERKIYPSNNRFFGDRREI
jgi:hypothetical protein